MKAHKLLVTVAVTDEELQSSDVSEFLQGKDSATTKDKTVRDG